MRSSRRGLAAFAVAAVLLLGLAFHFVNLTFDDAFISFRYAENLAEGRGLVFTPGERVEGYSNPLWTVLLAIPTALGAGRWELGMLVVAKCAGVAIALATLWVVRDLTTRDDPSKSSGWLALLYTAGVAPFALWSVGALETPLVTLFILLAVRAFVDEEREGAREPSFPHSPVWFLLAALTRPEPLTLFAYLAAITHRVEFASGVIILPQRQTARQRLCLCPRLALRGIITCMAQPIIHISEEEAVSDFASLLARVRAGAEVIIEHGAQPVAVLKPIAVRPGRLLSESIALAEAHGSTATLDGVFPADLEAVFEIMLHGNLQRIVAGVSQAILEARDAPISRIGQIQIELLDGRPF